MSVLTNILIKIWKKIVNLCHIFYTNPSLSAIIFLSIIIRCLAIDRFSETESMTNSFAGDEWRTVQIISMMKATNSLNPHYFMYPSFYINLCFFASYFIYPLFGDSWHTALLTARFISLFFGISTIFLTYKIGVFLYNERIGLLSSALLAINPLHVIFSITAKPDMMLLFFIMLSALEIRKQKR